MTLRALLWIVVATHAGVTRGESSQIAVRLRERVASLKARNEEQRRSLLELPKVRALLLPSPVQP